MKDQKKTKASAVADAEPAVAAIVEDAANPEGVAAESPATQPETEKKAKKEKGKDKAKKGKKKK